jgi:hypothetical protein
VDKIAPTTGRKRVCNVPEIVVRIRPFTVDDRTRFHQVGSSARQPNSLPALAKTPQLARGARYNPTGLPSRNGRVINRMRG